MESGQGARRTHIGPRSRLAILIGLITCFAVAIPRLQQEPSIEALVQPGNPALALRASVRETFGLKDPIVVALATGQANGMLSADALDALRRVTQTVSAVRQVDPEQVFSLSTQQWVRSEGDALIVEPVLPQGPLSKDTAENVERALRAMPIYRGTLIAKDGSAALIAAELRESDAVSAADAYEAIVAGVEALVLPTGMQAHVAGEGTTVGFLSRFIERDSAVLTPAAAVLMLLLLPLFLRSWQGLVAGAFVMLGTLAATVGAMAWFAAKFYIITTCMPAILLCISIADIIHYGERVARLHAQGVPAQAAIARGLRELGRPIFLTSLTNAAGFVGMAATTDQPSLVGYGAAAAFGVMVAWILTVIGVPALFRWLGLPKLPGRPTFAGTRFRRVGEMLADRPRLSLSLVSVMLVLGVWQTLRVEYNEDRILNFGKESSVYRADRLLRERFVGTHYLDVYLEAAPRESLLTPERIERIQGLQYWMEHDAGFAATYSFVNVLESVIRASRSDAGPALPATMEEAEQFLFLFEVSGKPGDLRQEITADRNRAYLRGYLREGDYKANHLLVEALQEKLTSHFAGSGVSAQPAGAVLLFDSFVGPYLPSTLWSIATSALLVGLMCALLMRSWTEGLLCMVPVAVGVICVFGLMGALGIWLSIATSMFASIGIGLGVDFAIHTLHAVRHGRALGHAGTALSRFVLGDVGRPLTANAVVLTLGFSVTLLSSIPSLRSFGLLVGATVCASYLSAILIIPALYALATQRRPALLQAAVLPEPHA